MVNHKESESESEGADGPLADEPRFRVRVCMRRFYGDEDVRARAYVCVSPRRRVRWLQRRLRRLFALPRLRLLSRGHLLPPQEPLALLQPDDPVEVVPAPPAPPTPPQATAELAETKRQALLMLEQLCAEPGAADGISESAARPRRRRVRRRRRVPAGGTGAEEEGAGGQGAGIEGAGGEGEGGEGAGGEGEGARGEGAEGEGASRVPAVCRDPAVVAMVLRNDMQPRAPRVVHPLPDPKTPTFLDSPSTEIIIGLSN